MDSNDLERERGITILAKNTAIHYQDTKINIVDTPGHADFGGEVERALKMVDGVLLLVDASEGPLPQTRYVLRKALEARLPPVVVINKIDRSDARRRRGPERGLRPLHRPRRHRGPARLPRALHERQGGHREDGARRARRGPAAALRRPGERTSPPPRARPTACCSSSSRTSTTATTSAGSRSAASSRAASASGDTVAVAKRDGRLETTRVTKLYVFDGLKRIEADEAACGEIVALAGFEGIQIGETVTSAETPGPPPRPAHRRADDLDGLLGQHLPLRGTRRALGHLAQHQGPAGEGAAHERLDPGRAHRLGGLAQGPRPRRAAARDPHRDHAPRGLRARHLEPRGHHPRRGRRPQGAARAVQHRPARDLHGRRAREDGAAQGQDVEDGEPRLGARAPRVPGPHPRPHRHPHRAADRHPRHRGHEQPARGLGRVAGRDPAPPDRRPRGRPQPATPPPTPSPTWRTGASSSSAPGRRSTRGWSSARTRVPTTWT